jgi:uncharacterized protein YqjF (DUF2071 family)
MQHPALAHVAHRPWPLPVRAWTWRQSWCDLLFAHWAVAPAALARFVPPGLALQTFDGAAWIGVVPFRMEGVMRRPLPDLPGASAFPELNVRTYVEAGGKPGVLFLSLDATNLLAVCAARALFALPYWWAHMRCARDGEGFAYRHARRRSVAAFDARYAPTGPAQPAAHGAVLPLRTRTSRSALPHRGAPRAVAAPSGAGRHRAQHDDDAPRNHAPRHGAGAPLRATHGRRGLPAGAGGVTTARRATVRPAFL